MWIVRLALRRPRTIAVMAILLVILGVLSIVVTPTDVFPTIDIPVVSVVWSYGGLSPSDMETRVGNISERFITTAVGNVQHIESESMAGITVIKVYFQPGTDIGTAITQISATCQTAVHSMPPGITPPLILQFQASDVPVLQLSLSSQTMTAAEINDETTNFVRTPLVTVQGVQVSPPFGGLPRLVNVDLNPQLMYAYGLVPADITNAITAQNLTLPVGDARIGTHDYAIALNNSTDTVAELNDLPITTINGAVVFLHDVAKVHMGNGPQVSMVDVNGKPSVLLTILKSGNSSTLGVVNRVKAALPAIRATLPAALHLDVILDQSIFVKASVDDVVREGVIAAFLTGLMILLFLGSWRSTLIVFLSIPLSILTSIIVLNVLGETLNTMTLGGMALAVGILVDDATVEIENTTRNLALGLPLTKSILTSASQIALPAFASTLSICIVFVPVAGLSGAARSLFLPMALAVIFAMLASYILSRTLVTTMMRALLRSEYPDAAAADRTPAGSTAGTDAPACPTDIDRAVPGSKGKSWLAYVHTWVDQRFESLREGHQRTLDWSLGRVVVVITVFLAFVCMSGVILPFVGEDFFPQVDSGEMILHVRTPPGSRIEEAGIEFSRVEQAIRRIIPVDELSLIMDNIGNAGSLNTVYSTTGTIGQEDGVIEVQLSPNHRSVWDYQKEIRNKLTAQFPSDTFYFQPADITSQILNFGIPAPIDIQIGGPFANVAANYTLAQEIQKQVARVSGVVDCYIYQVTNEPALDINVDRAEAMQLGLTQQDVASSVLDSLSSSSQTSPSFWINPQNGVQYSVSAETPQYKMSSIEQMLNIPVAAAGSATPARSTQIATPQDQLLGNVATIRHGLTPEIISHNNIEPVYDVYASTQDRDLGGVSQDVARIVARLNRQLPRGTTIVVQGQVATMNQSFIGLGAGMLFAVLLIYILLVMNFESWIDPLVILVAAPATLGGVVWMLFITHTTFSVPALMGTIMCLGVATANSILVVNYANDARENGKDAREAALEAGHTRLRPVIMTATAMIIGVLPMALGLGQGGEQNAPLGRAVIGGLLVATVNTLLFVPVMYSIFRRRALEPPDPSVDQAI
ncbi:MAG: efflux RND transporter permease subunit [Capsulimonadaceae bacterium]